MLPNFIPALVAGTALLASAAGPVPVTTIALGPQPPFGSAVQMAVNAGTNRIYVLNSTVSQLAPVAPSIAIIDIASSTRTGFSSPCSLRIESRRRIRDSKCRERLRGKPVQQ